MSNAIATRTNGTALVQSGGYIPSYDLAGIKSASDALFASGFFQDVRSAAQAMVKVMAGAELGIPPFAAMQGIHIIQGKPCLSAGIMAGKVKNSGRYDFRVITLSDELVEIAFLERTPEGWVQIGTSPFSIQDARRADVKNTGKFPRNMLYARAMSNGVKWHCPDIFLGPVYVPEEMGARVDDDGNVITVPSREINTVTGEIIEQPRTPVQREADDEFEPSGNGYGSPGFSQATRRPSDPSRDAPKHETIEGQLIHPKTADPATGRTAPIGRNEEPDPSFAPRTTDEEAKTAAALRNGIGSHKGWLAAKKFDPENKPLSLWLLNCAMYEISNGEHTFWTSRKELTGDQWTACNNYLAKLQTPALNKVVQEFYETLKREEAGTEDPFADETPEERANREAEALTGTLMDVEADPVAAGGKGHGDS